MDIFGVFLFLGGLGMFIYGMNVMSEGLENAAGDRMRVLLEKMTKNRFLGVLVGTLVTMLIQSSSATTVMVVGFVNAGLMNLSQAIGVIMGANIGTTITAQILAFKIDTFAPLILFIGVVLALFINKKLAHNIGQIVLGFGLLFIGMTLMSSAVEPLKTNETFVNFLMSFDNPVLAVLAGAAFTAIVQSSSASVGVAQAFAAQGLITFDVALFIILGMNIGTCITAVLAAIPSSKESKKAALMHVLFNVIGTIIFGTIIAIFPIIQTWIAQLSPGDVPRQIANFHLLFNVSTVVVLFPFSNYIIRFVEKVLPADPEQQMLQKRLVYLDKNLAFVPGVGVTQAHRELCRMGKIARDNLSLSLEAFFEADEEKAKQVLEVEETINFLNHQITGCLVQLRGLELTASEVSKLSMMFHVVADLERIGDHAENIAEYAVMEGEHKAKISPKAMDELREISARTMEVLDISLDIYEREARERLLLASEAEELVDDLQEKLINNHVNRLMSEVCDPRGGVVFTDMVTDLERCADHAINVAFAIEGEKSAWNNAIQVKQKKVSGSSPIHD